MPAPREGSLPDTSANLSLPVPPGRDGAGTTPYRHLALALTLTTALALRLWAVLAHTYVVSEDETFQYLEQGHRLAFGSGVVPWEYIDGIRSWLLPGAVAAVMRLAALIDPAPRFYILAVRLCCIAASLVLPWVGFRLGERAGGLAGGIVTGLLGAVWYEAVYDAPVVMTEPLATYAAILALWLGMPPTTARRLAAAGVLFGLAGCLRYQYAPALALAALLQHGRDRRALLAVGAAGVLTFGLGAGLLDWLTWGTPFQSVWLNFARNGVQGIGAAMGTAPWSYYPRHFLTSWGPVAPLLAGLALLGIPAMPPLAAAAAATVAIHTLTPHKELRFVFLAIAAAPLLIGLGLVRLRALWPRRHAVLTALGLAALVAGSEAAFAFARATPADAWHRDAATLHAFAAAAAVPQMCGLGVRSIWLVRSGGYTYLHRDVPIYFDTYARAQLLPHNPFRMRLRIVLDGKPVPQVPDAELPAASGRFNVLIGRPWDGLPGYAARGCFGSGARGDEQACVFVRPGGCD